MYTTAVSRATHKRPLRVRKSATEAMGEIVGLLAHSPQHRELPIKTLEWAFMPAIVTEQYRLFRYGPYPALQDVDPRVLQSAGLIKRSLEQPPLGVAVWASLSADVEEKWMAGEQLTVEEWRSGDRVWLIELICPFATKENRLSEVMMLDLLQGPLADTAFNLYRTDPTTGQRDKVRMAGHIDVRGRH